MTHVEELPARAGVAVPWPDLVPAELREALRRKGIERPWRHQAAVAELAAGGTDVVVATGTASGKSLAFLLPTLSALLDDQRATALYLSPTKALTADQLAAVESLQLAGVRPAGFDGDTPLDERDWVREHARFVLTNPDMLHRGLLPRHQHWTRLLRRLRYVVVDECHAYRGVFGSHVALVLRRLRRLARRYGADPVFVLASATVADPGPAAARLIGNPEPVAAVVDDAAPRAGRRFVMWEPPLLRESETSGDGGFGSGAPVRRSASAEAARMLADLVAANVRTLAFVRSRQGAEQVALTAQHALERTDPELAGRVAAYRGGYLPEDRRALERALDGGELLGVASTNALELGIDIAGLDAALLAGFPGTLASIWQQAGRAGRCADATGVGAEALVVFVARDDPLDKYLVHHPEAVFGGSVEAAVIDPENPHVLGPHLRCAAAELRLTEDELAGFGEPGRVRAVLAELVRGKQLRARPQGWYHTEPGSPAGEVELRGTGRQVAIVESDTGRVLGTVGESRAPSSMYPGAVHLHQGRSYLVDELHLPPSTAEVTEVAVTEVAVTEADVTEVAEVDGVDGVGGTGAASTGTLAVGATGGGFGAGGIALVHAEEPDWTTSPQSISSVDITGTTLSHQFPGVTVSFGPVLATEQVVGYQRRRHRGELLDVVELDMPPQHLATTAVWYTLDDNLLLRNGIAEEAFAGALHAAEHAAIGLLPLFAGCDRSDIGGLSSNLHPDTGLPTVIVYDGYPGGAGFAERGFRVIGPWLAATRDAIAACGCPSGCPSCVQSPKCGNGNHPLFKDGAVVVLDQVLAALAGRSG